RAWLAAARRGWSGVVGPPGAGERAGGLRGRGGAAPGRDLGNGGRVERELELQVVRRRDVERAAVAVVRHAIADARGLEPSLRLVEVLAVDFERDVRKAGFPRMLRAESLVVFRVRELKEGEGAAVREGIERVAVFELAARLRVVRALAPCRDERHSEQILEEAPVRFLVLRDPGMVMQAERHAHRSGLPMSSGRGIIHNLETNLRPRRIRCYERPIDGTRRAGEGAWQKRRGSMSPS